MTIEEMLKIKQEYGLSYEMISKGSGVPLSTVSKMLMRATKSPRRATVEAMTSYFESIQEKSGAPSAGGDGLNTLAGQNVSMYSAPENGKAQYVRESAVWERYARMPKDSEQKKDGSQNTENAGETHLITIKEREALPDDRRTELIDGVLFDMASPAMIHQELVFCIHRSLDDCIAKNNSPCKAYEAPLDVVLSESPATVLQPDVLVICPKDNNGKRMKFSRLTNKYYGAPELVVEVLSPSTKRKDMMLKSQKYLEAGVREYWMIDPVRQKVIVYNLDAMRDDNADADMIRLYGFDEKVPVGISEGKCSVDFAAIAKRIADSFE